MRSVVSKGVLQRILDAIKEGEHDPAVRAFVVIGAGRCFSRWRGHLRVRQAAGGRAWPICPRSPTYMDTVTKPIVAGIHGFALGGGLELALACHFRVRARRARSSACRK